MEFSMNRLIPEGSSDSQDDAFRLRVLTIATSLFPERTFKIPPESESIILADGVQLFAD